MSIADWASTATIVAVCLTILITFVKGFGRLDTKIDGAVAKLDAKIEQRTYDLSARIPAVPSTATA